MREAIQLLTGIPATDWDTDEERALVDRVRAQLDDASPVSVPPPPVRRASSTRTRAVKTTPRKGRAA